MLSQQELEKVSFKESCSNDKLLCYAIEFEKIVNKKFREYKIRYKGEWTTRMAYTAARYDTLKEFADLAINFQIFE